MMLSPYFTLVLFKSSLILVLVFSNLTFTDLWELPGYFHKNNFLCTENSLIFFSLKDIIAEQVRLAWISLRTSTGPTGGERCFRCWGDGGGQPVPGPQWTLAGAWVTQGLVRRTSAGLHLHAPRRPQLSDPSVTQCSLSCVQLSATPWTVACQAPLSMEFFQARILEWVAISSSRGSSWPKDRTDVC